MYALTIWQPWADAITRGAKRVENRSWPAPPWVIGETIAIHAGRRYDHSALPPPGTSWPHPHIPPTALPLGAVVAAARVTGCHHSCDCGGRDWQHRRRLPYRSCSPWAASGHYHWQLSEVRALPQPLPARGYQKLWRLPDAITQRVAVVLASPPGHTGGAA
jgi:hypothetical protein